MTSVSDQEIREFSQEFEKCYQRLGNGRVGMDTVCLVNLVKAKSHETKRFIEIYCQLAQSQPGYLQTAYIVAGAYSFVFKDDSMLDMVKYRVAELDAFEYIKSVSFFETLDEAKAMPPERTAAIEWWKTSGQEEGRCDHCAIRLRKGEGYMITDQVVYLGDQRVELGDEIICQNCFNKLI